MKKFITIILTLVLIAGAVCGAIFIPWDNCSSEETPGPETKLNYSVVQYGTSYAPTLRGNAKFKFCPEKVTITCNDVEKDVKPYTTVYAPVENEYYYILSFDNVIYYDYLEAGEYTATLNAYQNGEIAGTEEVSLNVENSLHYFQFFNSTTGEAMKGMNEDKSNIIVYDNFNDSQTEKNYFETTMKSDGLGQRTYGMLPVEKFGATVNLNEEGYITYALSAEEGYMLDTINLKSYVTLCHAGSADDYSKANIKVQISYDNVNFEDVYSLRADSEIADTWIDGKSYLSAKGPGVVNGISYLAGAIDGMTEIPTESPAGADCRFYIDQQIAVKGYVNTVYVRILCSNFAMTDKPLYAVPTRIHSVELTASQI